MACGGFTCSKNALAALNVLYILVAFILIGVAAYGKTAPYFTSLKLMGGIIACGVFLLLIAIVGLIGAIKHHQVLLFFYMIILFLLFLVQFAVACALLALNEEQQKRVATWGWREATDPLKNSTQSYLDCCGFVNDAHWHNDTEPNPMDHPPCGAGKDGLGSHLSCCKGEHANAPCCTGLVSNGTMDTCPDQCVDCWSRVSSHMNQAVKTVGGIGLFFSFTEIIGVWLAVRYRNQKDPRANPSAFL